MLKLTDIQALALHGMLTELTSSKIVRLTPEQRSVCDAVAWWWMDCGAFLANGQNDQLRDTHYGQNERKGA